MSSSLSKAMYVAGGGFLTVTMNGKSEIRSINIDPSLMAPRSAKT